MTIKEGGRRLMEKKNILNFHFDYLQTSLTQVLQVSGSAGRLSSYLNCLESFLDSRNMFCIGLNCL